MSKQETDTKKKESIANLFQTVPWYYKVLACLPLIGIAFGGAVGGGIGGAAGCFILRTAAKPYSNLTKFVLIAFIYLAAIGLYLFIVGGISLLLYPIGR